jgi:hypothetical protein
LHLDSRQSNWRLDFTMPALRLLLDHPPRVKYHLRNQSVDGEDNIKMYLKEMGYESVDWVHLSQHTDEWRAFKNMEMELWGSVQGEECAVRLSVSCLLTNDCCIGLATAFITISYCDLAQWRIVVLL